MSPLRVLPLVVLAVGLAVAAFTPAAAAAPAADDTTVAARSGEGALPPPVTVQLRTRRVAGWLALMQALVLAGLYRRRRSLYIKAWIAMWVSLAAILFVASIGLEAANLGEAAGREMRVRLVQLSLGLAALVLLGGVTLLGLSASWYRGDGVWPRWLGPAGAIFAAYTATAALTLGPAATFLPAMLVGLALYTVSALEFLRLGVQTRSVGAIAIGIALAVVPLQGLGRALLAVPEAERPDGLAFWTLMYGIVALGQYLLIFEDVTRALREKHTALVAANASLVERAITDPLTGCRNRRFFDEVAAHELGAHRRRRQPLALLFIDCNRFKQVNDTLGHDTGDRLLAALGGLLRASVPETDLVFRWGGDEFLVLLSGTEADARAAADRIRRGFAALPVAGELPAGCGISTGYVAVPPDATDLGRFIALADKRMYAEKAG